MPQPRSERREQILQALVVMLEAGPGTKITTARIAQEVGVSEAALYRHFPSKTKMFEALLEFAEDTIFARVGTIVSEKQPALETCQRLLALLLGFCERNPGISRMLHGEALAGEPERLQLRVVQLFDRFETQLRSTLRQAEMSEQMRPTIPLTNAAELMLAAAEGRISQFVRSRFQRPPTAGWNEEWAVLIQGVMRPVPAAV